jgi:hypothetical protein
MKEIKKIFLEFYNDRKQILFLSFLVFVEYQTRGLFIQDDLIIHATMGWIAVGTAVISGIASIHASNVNAGIAEDAATDAKTERDKQQAILDKQKQEYKSMRFKNPYENMENVYEDLTVNQQQADFQAQQGAQQRTNIMQNMRGAAGSSGIAGLAQALANQGALQTQQISASIGMQESRNQLAAARGAGAVQIAERKGDQWVQEAEMSRQATLLGMQFGAASGANIASAQAQANQMQAQMAQNEAWATGISNVGTAAAGADWKGKKTDPDTEDLTNQFSTNPNYDQYGNWVGNPLDDPNAANTIDWTSDRRLKKNINLIGSSPNGLNIYSFEYKDSKYGEGLFQGVMSDEMPQEVVGTRDGYDTVNYSMLDVEFKQI